MTQDFVTMVKLSWAEYFRKIRVTIGTDIVNVVSRC